MVEVESLGPEVWGLGLTAERLPGPELDGCLLGMLQDFGGAMPFRDLHRIAIWARCGFPCPSLT